MSEKFSRTELVVGREGMEKLKNAYVAVFGVGGVGGYAVEALVRSGVGRIDIFDKDTVSESNINRQIIATTETVGRAKVEVMRERALAINPDVIINAYQCFYMPDNADEYDFSKYTYIIDAVDTVTAKLEIVIRAKTVGVPVISSMGAGNKLEAWRFEVADIYKTTVCPLARTMRRELKKRGVDNLKVVYSKEVPIQSNAVDEDGVRRSVPGSVAFVPSVAGLIIAGEAIKDICGIKTS